MAAPAPSPRHTLRWVVLAILAVLVALAVALAVYVHSLLQPQRFTALLENDLATVGLRLDMQAPAEPTLFPRPSVQLHAFSLTNIGSNTPLLRADGATIVVRWRALLHGEIAIERIEVDAPRMDLGQLDSLLTRLPHHAAGPPRLPTVATGIQMTHGTLTRNGSPLLFDVSVRTGTLAPGKAFRLDASARTAGGQPFVVSIDTVPSAPHDGVIEFDPLRIYLTGAPAAELLVDGQGSWRGGEDLELRLKGTFRHRAMATAPTAASTTARPAGAVSGAAAASPPTSKTVRDDIAFQMLPARDATPVLVTLKLDGDDAHVDLRMRPTEFASWWSRLLTASAGKPPVPLPLTGTAQVQELDLGWLKATGIRIDAGTDLRPASSGTAVAPAAASSAKLPATGSSGVR